MLASGHRPSSEHANIAKSRSLRWRRAFAWTCQGAWQAKQWPSARAPRPRAFDADAAPQASQLTFSVPPRTSVTTSALTPSGLRGRRR